MHSCGRPFVRFGLSVQAAFAAMCVASPAIADDLDSVALADDLDSVVLADGTVLRGTVDACGEQIRFSPRGTEPEIELDAKLVRTVNLADGRVCSGRAVMLPPPPAPATAAAETPAAATAAAAPSAVREAAPSSPPEHWYGGPILALDAGAIALSLVGAAASARSNNAASALGLVGGGLYLFGGPFVHAAHGRPGRAVGSFFLRAGAPFALGLLGAWIGESTADKSKEDAGLYGGLAGAAVGLAAGSLLAIGIDAGTAYEPWPVAQVSFAPIATSAAHGVSFSVRF